MSDMSGTFSAEKIMDTGSVEGVAVLRLSRIVYCVPYYLYFLAFLY